MQALPFHAGEIELHRLCALPSTEPPDNPTLPGIALVRYASWLKRCPLVAVGTLDALGRPWTSLWGGKSGFLLAAGGDALVAQALIGTIASDEVSSGKRQTADEDDEKGTSEPWSWAADPVAACFSNKDSGVAVSSKMVSLLAVDLESRSRVKLSGNLIATIADSNEDSAPGAPRTAQLLLKIRQALGNCPKYMHKRRLLPYKPTPQLAGEGTKLSAAALDLVAKANMFFISTANADEDMDTNYRGGPPGFVRTRLISTSSSPTSPTSTSNDTATHHELIWPEYSGNRLYQTLGNLFTTPKAGLVFPDLATGDALYVTGTTKLHFGADAAALIPRSNLVVSLVIDASRFVLAGLSFRAIQTDIPDISPYTPRLRVLANETGSSQSQPGPAKSTPVAALLSQTRLTPTISRFKFSLPGTVVWKPGQYVVLDFGAELAMGYAHMRDDDPRSLNDDFVRTFTVSSAPPEDKVSESQSQEASRPGKIRDTVFEVTMRRIRDGPVTEFLFKQGLGERRATAIPLEIGVLGFEGVFAFDLVAGLPTSTRLLYVASGVGITPLLAQMEMLVAAGLTNRLTLFWTLKVEDAAFALDVLDVLRGRSSHEQGETTGPTITLFITGSGTHGSGDGEAENEVIDQLTGKCSVVRRRFAETDFQAWRTAGEVSEKNEQREQVLLCANPSLTTLVQQWLTQIGVEARSEGFGY